MQPQRPMHRLRAAADKRQRIRVMELIAGSFLLIVVSLFGHIGLEIASLLRALMSGTRGVRT